MSGDRPFEFCKLERHLIAEHDELDNDDTCYYFCEFTAKKGYEYSDANSLVLNFKKTPSSKKEKPCAYGYKKKAIEEVASLILPLSERFLRLFTIVPVPSSKAYGHEDYDSRLFDVFDICKEKCAHTLDVRKLVINKHSHEGSHVSDIRHDIKDLCSWYKINEEEVEPLPQRFLIFDDVLTYGAHYKAMQRILSDYYIDKIGHAPLFVGLFIARRIYDYGFNIEI